MTDRMARVIYRYTKNVFVAGIFLFFIHLGFFCWLKFLFFQYVYISADGNGVCPAAVCCDERAFIFDTASVFHWYSTS